jgi:hypothetical protein
MPQSEASCLSPPAVLVACCCGGASRWCNSTQQAAKLVAGAADTVFGAAETTTPDSDNKQHTHRHSADLNAPALRWGVRTAKNVMSVTLGCADSQQCCVSRQWRCTFNSPSGCAMGCTDGTQPLERCAVVRTQLCHLDYAMHPAGQRMMLSKPVSTVIVTHAESATQHKGAQPATSRQAETATANQYVCLISTP